MVNDDSAENQPPDEEETTPAGEESKPEMVGSDLTTDAALNDPAIDQDGTAREQRLDRKHDRLEQRELGLDKRADELDERETDLEERAAELDQLEADLETRQLDLDEREARIEERERELDEREARIEQREQQLEERTATLDRKEQTLEEYVDDQVSTIETSIGETVQESVSNALVHYDRNGSRLGTTGRLLIGVVGLALLAAGIANAVAGAVDTTTLLNSTTANVAVSAVLLVVGLSANLGAVTARV